jgi:hypothetical protein
MNEWSSKGMNHPTPTGPKTHTGIHKGDVTSIILTTESRNLYGVC